jgi:hypothetical protein
MMPHGMDADRQFQRLRRRVFSYTAAEYGLSRSVEYSKVEVEYIINITIHLILRAGAAVVYSSKCLRYY